MRSIRGFWLSAVIALASIMTAGSPSRVLSQAPASVPSLPTATMWSPTNAGLRIAIAVEPRATPQRGRLTVSLQNAGDAEFVVNLGSMLANGRVMFPEAVHLIAVDPAGMSGDLEFFDRRFPGVAGRIDDFVVALRSGAMYTFTVFLDQYWSPETKESPPKWTAGKYRLSARFDGRGASKVALDMPGIALMNFWLGTVASPAIEFVVTGR